MSTLMADVRNSSRNSARQDMTNDARPKLEISDASFNTRRLEHFEGKANGQKLARYVYQWTDREFAKLSVNSKFEFELAVCNASCTVMHLV